VPGRKDKKMVEETITQIEARIKKANSLNNKRKKELLDLLSTLWNVSGHVYEMSEV
jgi:hypothetical protein